MNIAILAHAHKKELMIQFCTAYAGILSRHTLCSTHDTGRDIAESTGLPIHLFLSRSQGGFEQIGARIAYDELDMVLFFSDPKDPASNETFTYIANLCDQACIPFASNLATAEMLVLGLSRGDLDWRDIVNPKKKPFTV